jgi:site-specific DNA-cytosine methylase
MGELLAAVEAKMSLESLSVCAAASQIGVTPNTLAKHLSGEYVRSDSAAKYRRWLAKSPSTALPSVAAERGPCVLQEADEVLAQLDGALPTIAGSRSDRRRVVDLFCGCGGLSLGFDLLGEGSQFDTVLAVDVEQSMLDVFNANRRKSGRIPCGRRVDLSDLQSEAEALAFYLDHIASGVARDDRALTNRLEALPGGPMSAFRATISSIDAEYRDQVLRLRDSSNYAEALRSVSGDSLRQTSVLSFHTALGLPAPGARAFDLPFLWWRAGEVDSTRQRIEAPPATIAGTRRAAEYEWAQQVEALRTKATGVGRGQLASSARRIAEFLSILDTEGLRALKEVWLDWRSARDAVRMVFFSSAASALRVAYEPWSVDVVVGGPPCQGFSRIGRGKIRSLRESGVQAHEDAEAGDERNRLLFAYVLMVSALRPRVFVFENVRHFQAEVRTPEGSFKAAQVLEDALREVSREHTEYGVASRIVHAVKHGIPQTRERYFMAGVRADAEIPGEARDLARWVLALPEIDNELPLAVALRDLPSPSLGTGDTTEALTETRPVEAASPVDKAGAFIAWVRQPLGGHPVTTTDSHVARAPRQDDQEWFALMGPGKRWLDYRVDRSESLRLLAEVLRQVSDAADADPGLGEKMSVAPDDLSRAVALIDGSLAIRLLLESISPHDGELGHHLLTPGYLSKRDGNHGDWLARLAADRPCKTITSHMGKDTYAYVHPFEARTLSVREAARVQTFPDWFEFGSVSLVDAFRIVGNAVPPLLSHQLAERIVRLTP